jgi:hypothetical protein
MRRVRGVVHGPTAGLTVPQKGGRLAREATLDRLLRPSFFLPLFTRVRGRGILRSTSRKQEDLCRPLEAQSTPSAS